MSRRHTTQHVPLDDGIVAEVTYKDVRHLRIRILPPDGEVRITAPHGTPTTILRRFLDQQHAWVLRNRDAIRKRSVPVEPLVDGGRARLWGLWHPLHITHGGRAAAGVVDGVIELHVPEGGSVTPASVLDLLYRRELDPRVREYLELWAASVGRSASRFRLRRMTSRWGSCNHRTGSMTFNVALAERPARYLEYVVVHEMVHLLVPGHGPDFHRHMDQLLPDWRLRRRELRAGA